MCILAVDFFKISIVKLSSLGFFANSVCTLALAGPKTSLPLQRETRTCTDVDMDALHLL